MTFEQKMETLFNHLVEEADGDYSYVAAYLQSMVNTMHTVVSTHDGVAAQSMDWGLTYRLKLRGTEA